MSYSQAELTEIRHSEDELDRVWFISDTHLNHARILELGDGRPFDSLEQHNHEILSRWASTVGPEDTVYHLGDVALGDWAAALGMIRGMPGKRFLIPGNHDRIFSGESARRRETAAEEFDKTFTVLPEQLSMTLGDVQFYVSHFPASEAFIQRNGKKDRFLDLRPSDDGTPIIHGHTHQAEKVSLSPGGAIQLSVGVDSNDWSPISARTLLSRYSTARSA